MREPPSRMLPHLYEWQRMSWLENNVFHEVFGRIVVRPATFRVAWRDHRNRRRPGSLGLLLHCPADHLRRPAAANHRPPRRPRHRRIRLTPPSIPTTVRARGRFADLSCATQPTPPSRCFNTVHHVDIEQRAGETRATSTRYVRLVDGLMSMYHRRGNSDHRKHVREKSKTGQGRNFRPPIVPKCTSDLTLSA